MSPDRPIALFISGDSGCDDDAPRLAAECGFRTFVAPWLGAESRSGHAALRRACEWSVDGPGLELPGEVLLFPALVGLLDRHAAARARAAGISHACGALWAHCDLAGVEGDGEWRCEESVVVCFAPHLGGHGLSVLGQPSRVAAAALARLDAPQEWSSPLLRHRTFAPCAVRAVAGGGFELVDCLTSRRLDRSMRSAALAGWLGCAWQRMVAPPALRLPESGDRLGDGSLKIDHRAFPELFGTPHCIDTSEVPDVTVEYLDPALAPTAAVVPDQRVAALRQLLARRRTADPGEPGTARLVEPGVGRACLVEGLSLEQDGTFHDFTVLGVGLTTFSEGGFVEIGRKVDGKAGLVRARHRKACAERLEAEGCRSSRVVALFGVPGVEIDMPDGTYSPTALVVRAFRCAYRVKQLDPLVCCLHSIQHTPLVDAYLVASARRLRTLGEGGEAGGLDDDDALARAIECHGASQESLRALLKAPLDAARGDSWVGHLRQARIEALHGYVPCILDVVRRRVALELQLPEDEFDCTDYLNWFAGSLGRQLATWKRLRFLHDYHHPGISRWTPSHLYTLGENNVTLMAEFPDLDTGVFVDDPDEEIESIVRLSKADIRLLRDKFLFFHRRDVEAAAVVVETLARLIRPGCDEIPSRAVNLFERSYRGARLPVPA